MRCVFCLQRIMRLPSGGLSTTYLTTDAEGNEVTRPEPGGVSCPTITGEIEGHRSSIVTTL